MCFCPVVLQVHKRFENIYRTAKTSEIRLGPLALGENVSRYNHFGEKSVQKFQIQSCTPAICSNTWFSCYRCKKKKFFQALLVEQKPRKNSCDQSGELPKMKYCTTIKTNRFDTSICMWWDRTFSKIKYVKIVNLQKVVQHCGQRKGSSVHLWMYTVGSLFPWLFYQ